jgi:hypothetical protein
VKAKRLAEKLPIFSFVSRKIFEQQQQQTVEPTRKDGTLSYHPSDDGEENKAKAMWSEELVTRRREK